MGRSWLGLLKTIMWLSRQSHARRSYIACSLRLIGLIRTVTNIFSSRTFGPPGVDAGVLCILDNGVAGVPTIFILNYAPCKRWNTPYISINCNIRMIAAVAEKILTSYSYPNKVHNRILILHSNLAADSCMYKRIDSNKVI